MKIRRTLGLGVATLTLSFVGVTMGAGAASAASVKPVGCLTSGGAAGIAAATASGGNVSCASGQSPDRASPTF